MERNIVHWSYSLGIVLLGREFNAFLLESFRMDEYEKELKRRRFGGNLPALNSL
jgi:hypothetical protein